MKRVVVVGCPGSGKSTLVLQLGRLLDLDVIHLDDIFWSPNRLRPSATEQAQLLGDILDRDRWILDGDFPETHALRFRAADTILFLDTPALICAWRIVARSRENRRRRKSQDGGSPPRRGLRLRVIGMGALLFRALSYPIVHRPRLLNALGEFSDSKVIRMFKRPADVSEFLASLAGQSVN